MQATILCVLQRMEYIEVMYLSNFYKSNAAQSFKRGIETIMRGDVLDFKQIKLHQVFPFVATLS